MNIEVSVCSTNKANIPKLAIPGKLAFRFSLISVMFGCFWEILVPHSFIVGKPVSFLLYLFERNLKCL